MAVQLSVTARNAKLQAVEDTVGATPLLRVFTGAQPADCAQADSGTQLVEITLPADAMGAPSGGSASKLGTWQANAGAAGVAAHFRMKDSTGATCHEQGSVTGTGGGGDMEVDNVNIANGQQFTVNTYTRTEGNA